MLTSFVIGSVISWFILSILYLISGLMAIQREEKYIKQSIDLLCKYNGIKIRKGERDIRTSSYYLKLGSENNVFELTSGNIRLHRIYLCIDCSLEINGVYTNYSCIKPVVLPT